MGEFDDSIANVVKARKARKKKDKLIAAGVEVPEPYQHDGHHFKPLFTSEDLHIFMAVVYKCMGNNTAASKYYKKKVHDFEKKENEDIAHVFFSLMFVPLMPDKKLLIDQLVKVYDHFELITTGGERSDKHYELRLSTYTYQQDALNNSVNPDLPNLNQLLRHKEYAPYLLNWDKYLDTILALFRHKHFFRRFKGEILQKFLRNAYIRTY